MGLKSVQHVGLPRGTVDKTITLDPAPANGDLMIFIGVAAAFFGPNDNSAWTGWTEHHANSSLVNATWAGPVYSKVCDGTETQITWQNPNSAPRAASCAILILDNDVTQILGQNSGGVFGWNPVDLGAVSTDTAVDPNPGAGTSWTGGLMIRCNGNVFNNDYTAETMDAAGDTVELGETWVSAIDEDPYLSTFATPMPGGTGTFDLDHTNWTTVPRYYAMNIYLETPTPTLPSGASLQKSVPDLAFMALTDGTEQSSVTITAPDAGAATITASENTPWLSVSPASGAAPATFTVTADATGLTEGQTYNSSITFTADAGYDPVSVPVSFYVSRAAPDSIAVENAKPGTAASIVPVEASGTVGYLGFTRQFSHDAGETVEFCVDQANVGAAAADTIEIYRFGHYGGDGKRLVATVPLDLFTQSGGTTIPGGNGDTTMAAWTTNATWRVPFDVTSGMFVGVVRTAYDTIGSWIPFVVRNDSVDADMVLKVNDSTWGAAYNTFGDQGTEKSGKSVYFQVGGGIETRGHAMSYDRPIVTRGTVINHFDQMELPFIDWAEANGFSIKYIGCYDLDQNHVSDVLGGSASLVSVGHDEYWSQSMWDNAVAFRDAGGHLLWMSGNAVFWRVRFTDGGRVMWCFKDSMPGPDAHVGGDPLDPVSWTGTWRDFRWPLSDNGGWRREALITGATFRMNNPGGDFTLTVDAATYGASPFWRDTTVETGTDLVVPEIVGFEADAYDPSDSGYALLAAEDFAITSGANNFGNDYSLTMTMKWGIVMFYATATSGLTVNFGTTQWAWGLSDRHDLRGSLVANVQMRQAMLNLLYDLGMTAASKQSDLVTPTPVALSSYGSALGNPSGLMEHTGVSLAVPDDGSLLASADWFTGGWLKSGFDGSPFLVITEFTVDGPGTVQTIRWYKQDTADIPAQTVFLLNVDTGSVVSQAAVDFGTETGWVSGNLPSPVAVAAGTTYAVGIQIPAEVGYYFVEGYFAGDPKSGVHVTGLTSGYKYTATIDATGYTEPTHKGSYLVDPVFVPDGGGVSDFYIGDTVPTAMYWGAIPVQRLYRGSTLIWEPQP